MSQMCNECATEVTRRHEVLPEMRGKNAGAFGRGKLSQPSQALCRLKPRMNCGARPRTHSTPESIWPTPIRAKKVAGGAALGALAAVVAPVGIATGAVIGAGIVAYRHVNKKEKPRKTENNALPILRT